METRFKIALLSIIAMTSSGMYGIKIRLHNYTPYSVIGDVRFDARRKNVRAHQGIWTKNFRNPLNAGPATPNKNTGKIGSGEATMGELKEENKNLKIIEFSVTVVRPDGDISLSYELDESGNVWFEVKEDENWVFLTYSNAKPIPGFYGWRVVDKHEK